MRFLGIGDSCDLGALYLRLIEEGHEVKVDIRDVRCHGTLRGLVARTPDWRQELDWVRAGDDGILLFEGVTGAQGKLQDGLRRDGFHVIGGSTFGDRLENDRAFAQNVLAELGLRTCTTFEFADWRSGIDFIDGNPGRFVLKFNGSPSLSNFVGGLADGRDVKAYLRHLETRGEEDIPFILMGFVAGIEMGVGAYFNGEAFLRPACLDWEHKRFFPGDLGELTGEMGTIVTFDRSDAFFDQTLGRASGILRRQGYCGYVNLNTIVNDRGIWPLEFTCRFGYPGFAILDPLQKTPWSELFRNMVLKTSTRLDCDPGFCAGIVLTTPPFPYSRTTIGEPIGLPVQFDGEPSSDERRHLHYGEVGLDDAGTLVTSGIYGWSMVATGTGSTVAAAQAAANALADRVLIPNVRYRRDIGDRLIGGDLARVEALGMLG